MKLALVNLGPVTRPIVLAAAQAAFPAVEILEVPTTLATAEADADLVVLAEPDEALVASATQAMDTGGAPRWAVVILAAGSPDVAETVPPEEWNARSLARVFRAAVLQHELLCENLRLRGDLKTIARRISHDLRTPTACIHTSSDLLNELSSTQGLAQIADAFRESSGEISRIIDRTGFVLRASAEPVVPSAVEMGCVVAGVLRRLETEIRNAGAVVLQPDSWPEVNGVPAWLDVIWWNLLHNALRHAGPGPQVQIGWSREDQGTRFSVSDHGPGVTPARHATLFTPFDQLHAVRPPGLGLSIVHRLVDLQGGRCTYEKQPEAGASFHFTLP